jgi:phosphomannomutase
MKFELLNDAVISTPQTANMLEESGGTVIETKVGFFWKTDGYDDQVPVPGT